MGTDTVFGRPGPEERGQARYSGARAFCRDLSMHLPTQIRGQTRCPVHRSGTFNVQRSTRNFQRGDRKGVWWAEYGDRHGIWTTGHGKYGDRHANWAPGSRKNGDRHDIRAPGLFAGTCQCTCRPRYGDRHDVRYADRERSTCNVQRATFNGVTERVQGGRNMGTDTAFGRPAMGNMGTDTLFGRPGPENGDRHDIRAPGLFAGTCQCTCRPRYGDRHDVRYADRERSTCNVQLATFNGVTERAQGGRNMGTDTAFGRPAMGNMGDRHAVWAPGSGRTGTGTIFGRPGFLPGPVNAPAGPDTGTDTMSGIPIRNV
jgi:hypothetical protein